MPPPRGSPDPRERRRCAHPVPPILRVLPGRRAMRAATARQAARCRPSRRHTHLAPAHKRREVDASAKVWPALTPMPPPAGRHLWWPRGRGRRWERRPCGPGRATRRTVTTPAAWPGSCAWTPPVRSGSSPPEGHRRGLLPIARGTPHAQRVALESTVRGPPRTEGAAFPTRGTRFAEHVLERLGKDVLLLAIIRERPRKGRHPTGPACRSP